MRLTKKEWSLRFTPKRLKHGRMWFYVNSDRVGQCSFHDATQFPQVNIDGIPVEVLLRALQARGYLRQWDLKAKRLRKATV